MAGLQAMTRTGAVEAAAAGCLQPPRCARALTGIKARPGVRCKTVFMKTDRLLGRLLCAALVLLPAAALMAAEPGPVAREIIPGSELMTAQERKQYRLRLHGAGTAEERERLRAEHMRAMQERARLRGLSVSDPSREGRGKR